MTEAHLTAEERAGLRELWRYESTARALTLEEQMRHMQNVLDALDSAERRASELQYAVDNVRLQLDAKPGEHVVDAAIRVSRGEMHWWMRCWVIDAASLAVRSVPPIPFRWDDLSGFLGGIGGNDSYGNDTRCSISQRGDFTIRTLGDDDSFTPTNLTRTQAAFVGWLLTEWARNGVMPSQEWPAQ